LQTNRVGALKARFSVFHKY